MVLWISCFFLNSLIDEVINFKTAPFSEIFLFLLSLFSKWNSLSFGIIHSVLWHTLYKELVLLPFINLQYFLTMSLCCPHHLLQRSFSLAVPLNCFSCNRTQAHDVLNISDEESGTFNIMGLQNVLLSS